MFSDFSILFVVIVVVRYNRHGTNSCCFFFVDEIFPPGGVFREFLAHSAYFIRFKFRLQVCCII